MIFLNLRMLKKLQVGVQRLAVRLVRVAPAVQVARVARQILKLMVLQTQCLPLACRLDLCWPAIGLAAQPMPGLMAMAAA